MTGHLNQNGIDVDVETIKAICLHATEPDEIWTALEASGIETTPGVVYQAITEQISEEPSASQAEDPPSDAASGLTAQDLAVLSRLAGKAGGVEPLIHVLSIIDRIAK